MVRSCEPISITDAPVIALVIGAVVLLLPDVASVEIPGIVRIENRIKEQEEKQEERQKELVGLVQNIKMSQGQYMIIGVPEMVEMLKRAPEKQEELNSDDA